MLQLDGQEAQIEGSNGTRLIALQAQKPELQYHPTW